MKGRLLKLWRWKPIRRAMLLYLIMRFGLSLWAVLALVVVPVETGPDKAMRPYLGSEPVDEGLVSLLLGPWQRFDTLHYIHLARYGYEAGTHHTVFPPLYPLLIRVVDVLLGEQYLLAALLVSNLSAIGYLTVFLVLAEREIGSVDAERAQIYAALYPWAFFLLAGYSEPLFLLLVGLALWMGQRGRGWVSGLCSTLAALTRLQGGVLALLLAFEALRARKFRLWPLGADLLWPVLPALASFFFLIGRAWAGIEPISITYATHWHHASTFPWVGMATNVRHMIAGTAHPTDWFDFLVACLLIVLTVIAWRQLSPIYALYMTLAVLFNIPHVRTPHPMCSVGRHSIEVFPVFFLLGRWGSRTPWLNRLILYPSIILCLYLSGQFVMWGWVG